MKKDRKMEIECCGVSYIVKDKNSTCPFCEKKLVKNKPKKEKEEKGPRKCRSGAQYRQLKKSGLVKPQGQPAELQPIQDEEYLAFLLEEDRKAKILAMQKLHPDLPIRCPLCEQVKPFTQFSWIRGNKEEFDILSPKYNEELVLAYGEIIREKKMVCSQCRVNYAKNNLPRTRQQQYLKTNESKLNYYMRNRKLLAVPEGGICPKCRKRRSLHHNAWAKSPNGAICRTCALARNP